jgi:choline-sulfatase
MGNSYDAANRPFTVRNDATERGGTAQSGSAWHGEQVLDYLAQRNRPPAANRAPLMVHFGFSHPHDTRDGKPELLTKYCAMNHADRTTLPPVHSKHPSLPENYLPVHPFPHGHSDVRERWFSRPQIPRTRGPLHRGNSGVVPWPRW